MELSKRLNWILEKTDKCTSIIDVGTDHGYIPIQLIKRNIANNVIATDINKEPLEKARVNASLDNVDSFIDLRRGGGLKPVKINEAEGLIIAGMGGNLIRDILEDDMEKVKKFQYIILQPAQNPEVLREYLYSNEYEIIDEDICCDENKYYELFKVKYSQNNKTVIDDDIFFEISPVMLKNKSETFKNYIINKIEKNEKIMKFINDKTESAEKRKEELRIKNEVFKKFLDQF